jgi:hypothetical protein
MYGPKTQATSQTQQAVNKEHMDGIDIYAKSKLQASPRLQYCAMLGVLDHFWPPVAPCFATEDAVQIVNSFYYIPITRNYIHLQLFLTLCHIYTDYNLTRQYSILS